MRTMCDLMNATVGTAPSRHLDHTHISLFPSAAAAAAVSFISLWWSGTEDVTIYKGSIF